MQRYCHINIATVVWLDPVLIMPLSSCSGALGYRRSSQTTVNCGYVYVTISWLLYRENDKYELIDTNSSHTLSTNVINAWTTPFQGPKMQNCHQKPSGAGLHTKCASSCNNKLRTRTCITLSTGSCLNLQTSFRTSSHANSRLCMPTSNDLSMVLIQQWNPSKADTIGTKDFVLYREVSLTQG